MERFDFGTTPHNVIADQILKRPTMTAFDLARVFGRDALLTVLENAAWVATDSDLRAQWPDRCERARSLRISILAALDIDESGKSTSDSAR